MGFCIGTPPSGAQNQATSFPTNMFILVALRQFKTVRILDKCPFKVGLCIGTPPSSAIPGVCLSAIYAKDVNISTSSMDKQIYIYIIYIIGRITPHVNNFPKLRRSKAKQEEPCDINLCDVNLYAVKLCAVNLCDVSLCDVNLCDSNMCDVNLCDVNLCDSNMCDVKLYDVNVLFVILCGVEEEGGRGGVHQKTKTPHVNVQNIYCIYICVCIYMFINIYIENMYYYVFIYRLYMNIYTFVRVYVII